MVLSLNDALFAMSCIILTICVILMCNIKKLNINSLFMIILLTCTMVSIYNIIIWLLTI